MSSLGRVDVLPVGDSRTNGGEGFINPYTWAGPPSNFIDSSTVAYVLWKQSDSRTRPTRVITSLGGGLGWKVGDKMRLYHDQTGLPLGQYKIVGIARNDNGAKVGNVPNRLIKHAAIK